jgi:hypothetical protein
MKSNQAPRGAVLSVALAVLGVLIAMSPVLLGQAEPNQHDLSSQIKTFANYSKDFRAMQEPLKGQQDLEVLFDLDHTATSAEERMYAANAALQMYDSISSASDRAKVKGILKEQLLDYYSWVFDQDVTRTAGVLTFIKVPAAAQLGLRMRDDMRAAKEKLDTIAASL